MTEEQKMLAGKIYHPFVEELTILRAKAHKLSRQFNNTDETDVEIREAILDELLPTAEAARTCKVPCNLTTAFTQR